LIEIARRDRASDKAASIALGILKKGDHENHRWS
jgi:hypothetical protein